ncbi:MAG: MarR family winged helix-turn-helix transcriptional regulator [Acidiferrobacteraceae bacterium]
MKRSLSVIDLIETARLLERQASLLLADAGLTLPQFRVLSEISDGTTCTVGTLSERLHVTKPYTTSLLRDMVQAELVTLRTHPLDRRSALVETTDLGRRRLAIACAGLDGMDRSLKTRVPAATLHTLHALARPGRRGRGNAG